MLVPYYCKKCLISKHYYSGNCNLNCQYHKKTDAQGKCTRCSQYPENTLCYHSWSSSLFGYLLNKFGF